MANSPMKPYLENAPLPAEYVKMIEEIVVGALAEGRPIHLRGLAAYFGTNAITIGKIVARVEASYGQSALRKGRLQRPEAAVSLPVTPAKESTPHEAIPISKLIEIAEFYEAGYSIPELASEYGHSEAELLDALAGLGAESPSARAARLEREADLRRSEEAAWDEEDRRRGLAATAAAIEAASRKAPPEEKITPAPEPISAPSSMGGPAFYHGKVWEVELAPLGTGYPTLDYIRGLEAEKKFVEVGDFRHLVKDYADNGALPNMKYKALTGAMAGFWELAFGRQRQQRVFTRPVSILLPSKKEVRVWVILNGFTKKTDATPPNEIARAHRAWNDYLEALAPGGRALKRGKKNPDENLDAPDEDSRRLMSSIKLIEEYQLAIQGYMKRNGITQESLSKKTGLSVVSVAETLDSPYAKLDDLVKIAFDLGLQLHGHIGPLGY